MANTSINSDSIIGNPAIVSRLTLQTDFPVLSAITGASNTGTIFRVNEDGRGECTCSPLLARLLELLALPSEVRGFLEAAARAPADRELLLVFADWLEERGHEAAGRVREVAGG